MSSHWRSSRWSSAREREEQERAKAAEKNATRRSGTSGTRKTGKAAEPEPTPAAEAPSVADVLASSRQRRQRKWPYPEETTPEAELTPTATTPARSGRSSRGTGSRSRRKTTTPITPAASSTPAATTAGSGGAGLPPLPDEEPRSDDAARPNSSRLLIFGLVLFVAIGFFAWNPGDIFPWSGGGDPEPTPSEPSMIVPTALNTLDGNTNGTTAAGTQTDSTVPAGSGDQVAARGETVCIDAGHGGWDTGFTREANERAPALEEADVNLAMSYMLKERLEAEGFRVVLTRPSGSAVNIWNEDINGDGKVAGDVQRGADDQAGDRDELQARILICNEAKADILISLHINGFTDSTARGYEVIYTAERDFGQQNTDLAFNVYDSVTAAYAEVGFDSPGRGAKADSSPDMGETALHEGRQEQHYVMTGPAVNAADFTIIPSAMPGIICEAGFISSDADAAFLADPQNLQVIVDAYASGIITYFDRYPGPFQP